MNFFIVLKANPAPLPGLVFSFSIVETLRSSFQFHNVSLYASVSHQHNRHESVCKT